MRGSGAVGVGCGCPVMACGVGSLGEKGGGGARAGSGAPEGQASTGGKIGGWVVVLVWGEDKRLRVAGGGGV
eukprot:337843-Pleurochrysis_carterae.AAC.1